MLEATFKEMEQSGWVAKARAYDSLLATITSQAIGPTLESFGSLTNRRFLDMACGTGHLAGNAAKQGAMSEGIDFASTMIAIAKSNYPNVKFTQGDVEQLPYEDKQFDAIACAFGLLHLEHPEKAIKESWRVLKDGGRFCYTTWCGPDQGGEYFGLIIDAIKRHGTLAVSLPPAPPTFMYADQEESKNALVSAGFKNTNIKRVVLKWHAKDPQDILDLLYKSIVRLTLVLEAQSEQVRKRIHSEILEVGRQFQLGETLEFKFPIVLATAEK